MASLSGLALGPRLRRWLGRPFATRARPVVLCVVDRPNWAHDRKTDALARELAGSFEIVKRYQDQVNADDLVRADGVLLYYWLQVERLAGLRAELAKRRDRLMIGVCSHYELEGAWREPAVRTLNGMPAAVFANNRRLFEEMRSILSRPVHYTPNGVDVDFFRPGSSEVPVRSRRPFRVGWAGSLTNHGPEHRGVREVIEPAAERAGVEVRLAVREETWRDRDEMLEFYRGIDVYLCASRSEGTPNPCLEASACGLPVITTPVGNMPELIRDGENGFFAKRDPGDFAAKIVRLRDDEDLRRRMGRAARAAVEDWSWSRQAARYAAMFRAVLAGGSATKEHSEKSGRSDGWR